MDSLGDRKSKALALAQRDQLGHRPSQDWQVSQGEGRPCTREPGLHKCQSFARASGHREIDLSEWLRLEFYIFTTCTYGIWQWLPRSSFWTLWLVLFPPSSSSDFLFKYNVFKHIHSPVCNSYDHPLLSDTCHASSVCMNSVSWLLFGYVQKGLMAWLFVLLWRALLSTLSRMIFWEARRAKAPSESLKVHMVFILQRTNMEQEKSDSRTICIWYVNSRYILIYMYNLVTKKKKKKPR